MGYILRIAEVRKAVKITQEELAKKLGINRATLSKYENGTIDLSLSQLQKIAEALGVEVWDLLDAPPLPKKTISLSDNDDTPVPFSGEDQEFYSFSEYLNEMGYSIKLDLARFDNPEGEKGTIWVIHDKRKNVYYGAKTTQLNNLMDSILSYTKFQMHELLSTLDPIPEYQKKDEPGQK